MKKLTDLIKSAGLKSRIELNLPDCLKKLNRGEKLRVNIFALGDVGTNLLVGLRLLGGEIISEIGIYDIREEQAERLYLETSQIYSEGRVMPTVRRISQGELFDCDCFIFCASAGIPSAEKGVDVRMAQLDSNGRIISHLAEMLQDREFDGMILLVSDPVDPLCDEFLRLTNLRPAQIRGFGLGVMYARGRFYAERDLRFRSFLNEGRAFGPHGKGLVLANSIDKYDNDISLELTRLAVDANMKVRELGFKPFIAPAFSSGALSIISFLKGEWSYGSFYLGDGSKGAFLGARSKMENGKIVWEDLSLDDELFERIEASYVELVELGELRRG